MPSKPLSSKKLSIVIPVFNEERNIPLIHEEISRIVDSFYTKISGITTKSFPLYAEIIFVNDGSVDGTSTELGLVQARDSKVRVIEFSRNFGKEAATTAGIREATGDAVLLIDADLQHPVELIPYFIDAWLDGAEVVVGVRNKSKSDHPIKRMGSKLFYKLMKNMSDTDIIAGETDFRLIDRIVVDEFNTLTEQSRITRGLVNWLGFKREYIYFDAKERQHGSSTFNIISLTRLAISSFVSHSLAPLRLASYFGLFIVILSGILFVIMLTDKFIVNLGFYFSGPALLADLILFLVGILLIAIGILAVYVGNIHQEVQNRPLYIIRRPNK